MLHVWFYGCEVIRCSSPSDSWMRLDCRGGGERGEGMCVRVGTRTAQSQACSTRGEARQAGSAVQCLWRESSLAAGACCKRSGEALPKMAMIAGTAHWSPGEMLRVIC